MMIWTALLLGIVGSLHCAGMCGPLMLALPSAGATKPGIATRRLAYNAGRIVTYTAIGSIFGLVGQSLALAGLQRWISIAAGLAILTGLMTSSRFVLNGPLTRAVATLKTGLNRLLLQRGLAPQFGLGMLNGLLPCGLVYVACAGAAATGSVTGGLLYMLAFGLGTVPMMLALGLAGQRVQLSLRFKLQRFVPVCLGVVGALLILRGLSLGIPYLSPILDGAPCH